MRIPFHLKNATINERIRNVCGTAPFIAFVYSQFPHSSALCLLPPRFCFLARAAKRQEDILIDLCVVHKARIARLTTLKLHLRTRSSHNNG